MSNRERIEPARVERLEELLETEPYAAVWLAHPNSFAWLTGGIDLLSALKREDSSVGNPTSRLPRL
jgi:hypothetical protein